MGDAGKIYDPGTANQFNNVDKAPDSSAFVGYLEGYAKSDFVAQYVRASVAGLGLAPGMSHLEVGCGVAHDLPIIAEAVGNSGRVTLIDNSETMLRRVAEVRGRAAQEQSSVDLHRGDGCFLPYPNERFDTARIVRVLQHLSEPEAVLSEMVRALKSGGRLCAIEPNWSATTIVSSDVEVTEAFIDDMRGLIDGVRIVRSPRMGYQLERMCKSVGLEILESREMAHIFGSFEAAAEVITFKPRLEKLVSKEVISQQRADDWLQELQILSRDGLFNVTLPYRFVVGRKA